MKTEKIKQNENGREAVANSGERVRSTAEANSLLNPLDGSREFKVSPYGVFRGRVPGRQQHFDKPQAEKMVTEFNSMKGKLGRMFRGMPIYIGHPDADRATYPDERRLGKVVALEAREDGLWAVPEWNSLGRENIEEGYWVFPSPYWDAPAGQEKYQPDRLLSVGLTNTPNIEQSEPVANTEQTNQNDDMNRKKMIEILGLEADATDEEIQAAAQKAKQAADAAAGAEAEKAKEKKEDKSEEKKAEAEKEDAANSKLKAAETAREAAENAAKQARDGQANALLDLAIHQGKISKSERDDYRKKFDEDFESAANGLAELKPKLNQAGLDLSSSRQKVNDARSARETVANAVAVLTGQGVDYDMAWNQVRKNPKYKDCFEVMREPSK